jgi:KUP system potassium uptake protein
MGTGRVGTAFGPVMLVWFGTLGLLGLTQIVQHPVVLRGVSPLYGAQFFVDNSTAGFLALGSVFLVVTGGEALYADMGHFGRKPLAIGWYGVVLPGLLLNYAGQGATLLDDPAALEGLFYEVAPAWSRFALAILATGATVIASQAMISGAFSLTMQAVQLDYLPRVRIRHTSVRERGQIYVASVNWALMVACIAMVIGFGSSARLASAYGVAVTTTMVITTVLLFFVARERWHWSLPAAAALAAIFLVVDLAFFAANIFKVAEGGWLPLLVGLAVVTVMTTWRRGRQLVAGRLRGGRVPIDAFLSSIAADPPTRVPGATVYLNREPLTAPPALVTNFRVNHVLPEQIVLITVLTEDSAYVPGARRATISHLGQGFFQVNLCFGFAEQPDLPTAIRDHVAPETGISTEATTYVLGIERVVPSSAPGMSPPREQLFALLHRNAEPASLYFGLPTRQVVEIGQEVEL